MANSQNEAWRDKCQHSDYCHLFKNKTQQTKNYSQYKLDSITINSLLDNQTYITKQELQIIKDSVFKSDFVEVSTLFEDTIAPLISAYLVTRHKEYLNTASELAGYAHSFFQSFVAPTYIYKSKPYGAFGENGSYIDQIHDVYLILGALDKLLNTTKYAKHILQFIDRIFTMKYSLYDIRTGKPIGERQSFMSIQAYLSAEKLFLIDPRYDTDIDYPLYTGWPVELKSGLGRGSFNLHLCSTFPYLKHSNLSKMLGMICEKLYHEEIMPMLVVIHSGGSEKLPFEPQFDFETNLLDLFWTWNNTELVDDLIFSVKSYTKLAQYNAYTGLKNVKARERDGILSHTIMSRWLVALYFISAGYPFRKIVRSKKGHLLAIL